MNSTTEKTYKSTKDTVGLLFLIAYILSVAARNNLIPVVIGYIALIPVAINLILYIKLLGIILGINHKKTKRKRIASVIFGLLINLFIATLVLWQ